MCEIGTSTTAIQQTLTGTSTTDVAGASGGGPALSGDVVAQLQATIDAISALTSALGGSSALGTTVSAGGPGGVVQQGDPTQMPDMKGMPGMGDAPPSDPSKMPDMPGMKHGAAAGHEHIMIPRDTPVDKARATKIAKAVQQFFGNVKRSQVEFGKGGGQTHGKLPESLRAKFKQQFPGLPAPRSVVFPKGGNKPIGVVFNEKVNGNFDLGMGMKHKHSATGSAMEHVWFTPGDLDLAYADSSGGTTKKVQAYIKAHAH